MLTCFKYQLYYLIYLICVSLICFVSARVRQKEGIREEILDNLTRADVYSSMSEEISSRRESIKQQKRQNRRQFNEV
jgi:uncharacterized protein YqeY